MKSFPLIREAWRKAFGEDHEPQYRIIAPGRVNIIGEHIDHQNYSVLPCAIEKSVQAIVRKVKGAPALSIAHLDSTKYPAVTFTSISQIKINANDHQWYNYIVAAYLGAVEFFGSASQDPCKVGRSIDPCLGLTGEEVKLSGEKESSPVNFSFELLIYGDLPAAAGLSSSSALVVCGLYALDCVDRTQAAVLCANAERFVGTAGGGMDQAAICLSEAQTAQHIGFNPLTHESVRLPKELTLIVANTCREAPKARDMAKMYNKRVFELKAACFALITQAAPELAAKLTGDQLLATGLREVCRDIMKIGEKDLLAKLSELLPDAPLSKADIDDILPAHLKEFLLQKRCGQAVWEQNEIFHLHRRIRHVLEETLRVQTFVQLCKTHASNDPNKPTPKNVLRELGDLMNESQRSLRAYFDCSCLELDELTEVCVNAGALGSRLTGAGWGGCTVSLVLNEHVGHVLCEIKREYYEAYWKQTKVANPPLENLPSQDSLQSALFATSPGPAARKSERIF